MGSKKKRIYGVSVARMFKRNWVITLTAPEISYKMEPVELPYCFMLANSNGEIALRTERFLSESRFKTI